MGLAGPRTKQRIGADPNNLHWSNDTGKFGHKMLTKMGWAPGKGLGANEDGNTEHVKVRLKDNNFGIGANKKNMDNWLDNTDAFSRLLADLNERVGSEQSSPTPESPESKKEESDESDSDSTSKKSKKKSKKDKKDKKSKKEKEKKEKKSKKAKKEESSDEEDDTVAVAATTATLRNAARAKFLRAKRLATGKDVESMSQILGIKSNSASAAGSPVSSPTVSEEQIEVTTMESTTSVPLVVKKVNVQDYFALKMKNVKVSGIASSGLKYEEEEEDDAVTRPSFGGLGFSESKESSSSLGFGLGSRTNGLVTGNGLGFVKSTTAEMTVEVNNEPEVKEIKSKSKKRKSEESGDDNTEKPKSKKGKKEKNSDDDSKKVKKEKKEKKEKKSRKEKKEKKDSKKK